MSEELIDYNQKFKIFGRKKGRKSLNYFSAEIYNKYLLNMSTDLINKKIILDIGSGNGENTIFLSQKYPNHLIVASEIYQDGNINLSQHLQDNKIGNIKIFNKNILLFFEQLNFNNFIKEIWILFPDPWPKKKHYKRRLINSNFIEKVSHLLEKERKIYIATDSVSYLIYILNIFHNSKLFNWVNDLPNKWEYSSNINPKTKYYKQALRNNKKSFLLIFQKI